MKILFYVKSGLIQPIKGYSMVITRLAISIIILIVSGCSSLSQTSGQAASNQLNTATNCPEKPGGSLDSKNVKPIQLGIETVTESGQAKVGKYLGYSFEAKSGQKLSYRTGDDICIWVYAPDNRLISSEDLSQSGKYIIQISAPKGSTTFELVMGLDVPQPLRSPNQTASTTSSSLSKRPVADEFVRNHYIALNNRQYTTTWSKLSPQFKSISGSYSNYQQWWNSVKEIRIGDIKIVNQTNNSAVVDAELWYVMHGGRVVKDSKSYIYLIWSNESNSWLFERKSTP